MRTIEQVETDLLAARERCIDLQRELDQVSLAEFLKEQGVPNGARPVFRNTNGELILIDKARPGKFGSAEGRLLKKDGSISKARRLIYLIYGECEFVNQESTK